MAGHFSNYADDARKVAQGFWSKLRGTAAHVPFAEDAVAIYYCSLDRATPVKVRAAIMGALAYFVMPVDAVPDVVPLLGFTDDAAILAATLQLVSAHVRPEHREAARRALAELDAGPARAG